MDVTAAALSRDNPRLKELEAAYADLHLFEHSLWGTFASGIDIANFRGEHAYLAQAWRGMDEQRYRNTFDYVKRIDQHGWLDRLTEDGAFGALTYTFDGKMVSRDLLDSLMEFYFVQEALGLSGSYLPARWLDLGAGYGRLAHRLTALKELGEVTCLDGVALSTYLCEFYAAYRSLADRIAVVPLHELSRLNATVHDIAVNIHSWSECSSSAINFWLDRLIEWDVPYLFVVPHDNRFVCVEPNGQIGNFRPLIEAHGYRCIAERPKYKVAVDGLYPEVYYIMFKRG